jgi:hypothetical protein
LSDWLYLSLFVLFLLVVEFVPIEVEKQEGGGAPRRTLILMRIWWYSTAAAAVVGWWFGNGFANWLLGLLWLIAAVGAAFSVLSWLGSRLFRKGDKELR